MVKNGAIFFVKRLFCFEIELLAMENEQISFFLCELKDLKEVEKRISRYRKDRMQTNRIEMSKGKV